MRASEAAFSLAQRRQTEDAQGQTTTLTLAILDSSEEEDEEARREYDD